MAKANQLARRAGIALSAKESETSGITDVRDAQETAQSNGKALKLEVVGV